MEFIGNFTVPRDNRSNSDEIEKMSSNSDDSNAGANTTISELDSVSGAYVPGTFEGPEKNMEVVFKVDKGNPEGLRSLSRLQLDTLCTKAKCTILSKISNTYMDAYVLSESSLFVYKHRYIMKTCGTTTLLRCLSTLLEYADALGMEVDWVGYSRKNLLFPDAQLWPHSNFGDEIRYMHTHGDLQDRLRGSGYILGPITGDHWFVYVADSQKNSMAAKLAGSADPMEHTPRSLMHSSMSTSSLNSLPSTERTLNMMMFDMAPEIAAIFFQSNTPSGKEMTAKSGIAGLCPGAAIDEASFTPCGYSMNAILHDSYFTIHITPEQQCSYVSFETNTSLRNYSPMVRNVLNVFRPKRFVLTFFGDEEAIHNIPELPTDPRKICVPGHGSYARTSLSSTKVESELNCLMGCYSFDGDSAAMPRERGYSFNI